VSEAARSTLTEHLDTDAVVVPNGIYAKRLANGSENPSWTGNTLGFIGRFEEPRKGLALIIEALPKIIREFPDIRVLIAGPGDAEAYLETIKPELRSRFEFLGRISESEKADFLQSISLYIAPNNGGESFGIILAEALAGGAAVVASDIPAFVSLLGGGEFGTLFESENVDSLSTTVINLLKDTNERDAIRIRGKAHAQNFDWDQVAERIYAVYEMSMVGLGKVTLTSDNRSWNRFLGK
jgi:phosphatidylinositol alpha-mannosyltransferase